MTIEKTKLPNQWFLNGIPPAFLVAPWQSPNLKTTTMYPDETGSIDYKLNSLGYRDAEWQSVDNKIWCIGHSDVFGIGIAQTDTWASQILNSINLGIVGAAWDTIARVVCSGLAIHSPKCVVIQSTTKERKEYITEHKKQVVLPSMPSKLLPHSNIWTYDDDVTREYSYEKNIVLIELACKSKGIPLIIFEISNRWDIIASDPAVDNQHIGIKTHREIGVWVIQELQLRGIL